MTEQESLQRAIHERVMLVPHSADWPARFAAERERLLELFSGVLRADSVLAGRYADLKARLAMRYPLDREAYTQAKGDFVREVLAAVSPGCPRPGAPPLPPRRG